MLMKVLFRCCACDARSPAADSFPLCRSCSRALLRCPPLCQKCASTHCDPKQCSRPWIRDHLLIQSYSGAYLLLSECYRVLKRWKTRRGRLFDHQILRKDLLLNPGIIPPWQKNPPTAIIPVPQNLRRSWALGGSASEIIASQIAKNLQIPLVRGLLPNHPTQFRQAELSAEDRMKNRLRFQIRKAISSQLRGKTVLLIDDFMTTGHTLRRAALALKLNGVIRIHAYCLGVRPSLSQKTEEMAHLMHRT